MRLLSKSTAIILTLLFVFGVAGASFGSADSLLAQGDQALAAAKAAKLAGKSADKTENYDKALKVYAEVQKSFPNTPQGATAMLHLAQAQADFSGGDHNTLYAAHKTLTQLIDDYSSPEKLQPPLSPSEVAQTKKVLTDAKALETDLRVTLNKQNSEGTLYKIMDTLVKATGKRPAFSYWFAIVLLTIVIKVITMPMTRAQFKSMKEMQMIAPKIKEIQEKHKGDQKAIGEKTMALYKEHHINPFASCLPILIQMPILMILYYTMKAYEFQFLQAKFLWIGSSLSHLTSLPVPSLFGSAGGRVWLTAGNLAEPDLILLLLYLVSMYISTKMSSVDPSQADQQKMMAIMMPLMFGFIFASFPSAFLLYWLLLNVVQTVQQYLIMHKPAPELATAGGVIEPPKPDDGQQGGGRQRRRR